MSSFFSKEITDKPQEIILSEDTHLQKIILNPNVLKNETTRFYIETNNSKLLICNLTPNRSENLNVDILLKKNEKIKLSTNLNSLHLIGYKIKNNSNKCLDNSMQNENLIQFKNSFLNQCIPLKNLFVIEIDNNVILSKNHDIYFFMVNLIDNEDEKTSVLLEHNNKETTLCNLYRNDRETVFISYLYKKNSVLNCKILGKNKINLIGRIIKKSKNKENENTKRFKNEFKEKEDIKIEKQKKINNETVLLENLKYEKQINFNNENVILENENTTFEKQKKINNENVLSENENLKNENIENESDLKKDKFNIKKNNIEFKENEFFLKNNTEDKEEEFTKKNFEVKENLLNKKLYSDLEKKLVKEIEMSIIDTQEISEFTIKNDKKNLININDKKIFKTPKKGIIKDKFNDIEKIRIKTIKEGEGTGKKTNEIVNICYELRLLNGKLIENRETPFIFTLGQKKVIEGLEIGVKGMKKGEIREIIVPSKFGYKNEKVGKIPANSVLCFIVRLLN